MPTTPPADSPASPPPPADAGGAAKPDDTKGRLDAVEAEQQRQGGILDRIEQALNGGGGTSGGREEPPPGPSIADLVREGVDKIEAGKREEERAAADAAWRAKVDEAMAEKPPAEPSRWEKARGVLFGREPAARR